MSHIEKEKLIKADIASIENRVRHAFNQGYDLGFKDGKERVKPQEPSGDNVVSRDVVKEQMIMYGFHAPDMTVTEFVEDLPPVNPKKPTNKNDLGVDCISRADVKAKKIYSHERHEYVVPVAEIDWLPSVTPQLSSELEKNSKKLEKNFGELDCISREQAIEGVWEIELAGLDNKKVVDMLKALPSVTLQEPKILALLDKTFDDFCNCPGGESYFHIDGEDYNTDAGYALEGMEIFIKVLKKRLAESEG